MGGGGKSFPFDKIGDTVTGQVISPPEVRQQTDMKTGEPKFWPNGQPQIMYMVQLQTALQDPQDPFDDGVRAVFLKWKSLDAVRAAIRASGAKTIEVGGTLTLTYSGDDIANAKRGNVPPKLWAARYIPASQSQFMATPNAQPEPEPQYPPAPPGPYNGPQSATLDRLRQQHANNPALNTASPPPF
jgi:hypothetical protein